MKKKREHYEIMPAPPLELSGAELRALALRAREGDQEAKEKVLRGIFRLILKIAKQVVWRTKCNPDAEEDLFNAGIYYATRYLQNYDGSSAVTTYLGACVWGMLIREARIHHMCEAGARLPLHCNLKKGDPLLKTVLHTDRHGRVSDGGKAFVGEAFASLAELVPSREAPVWSRALREDNQVQLEQRLDSLNTREREVIRLRHGLWGSLPMTLDEVGRRIECSRERARQIQVEAERALGLDIPIKVKVRRRRRIQGKARPRLAVRT